MLVQEAVAFQVEALEGRADHYNIQVQDTNTVAENIQDRLLWAAMWRHAEHQGGLAWTMPR